MKSLYEIFLKKFNEKLLTPPASKRQRTAVQVGPVGRPDSFQLLAEDGQNAWKISKLTPPTKAKHIVFSDSFLFMRTKAAEEYALWNELTKHNAVYLWQGSDVSMQDHAPVLNADDFWQQTGRVKQESKKEIAAALAAQGKNLEEYIILDTVEYCRLLDDWCHANDLYSGKYSNTETEIKELLKFLLTQQDGDYAKLNCSIREIAQTLPLAEIKQSADLHGRLSDLNHANYPYHHLKRLRAWASELHQEQALIQFLQEKADHLPEELVLTVGIAKRNSPEKFVFPTAEVKSVDFTIYHPDTINEVNFSRLQNCEKITIASAMDTILSLSNIHFPTDIRHLDFIKTTLEGVFHVPANLESLAINAHHCNLDTARNGALRSLTLEVTKSSQQKDRIEVINFENLQLTSLDIRCPHSEPSCRLQHLPPTLTTLRIKGSIIPPDINHCTSLQTLTIDSHMNCPDLSQFTNLQTLHLNNVTNIDLRQLPASLRSLHIGPTQLSSHQNDHMDFSQFIHLRELKLSGFQGVNIKGICPSVNILEINNCENLAELNLGDLDQLHMLSLKNVVAPLRFPTKVNHLTLYNIKGNLNKSQLEHLNLAMVQQCYSLWVQGLRDTSKITLPEAVHKVTINCCPLLDAIDFKHNSCLTNLRIYECNQLASLPALPPTIEELSLLNNASLATPALDQLNQFKTTPLICHFVADSSDDENSFIDETERMTTPKAPAFDPAELPISSDFFMNERNQTSSTALLDLGKSHIPDSRTGGPPAKKDFSHCKMKVTLYTKQGVTKDHYRVHVLDSIKLVDQSLSFVAGMDDLIMFKPDIQPHLGDTTSTTLKQEADRHTGMVAGEAVVVKLTPGTCFPLTTLQALPDKNCLKLFTNCKDLDFFWSESTKQCFVQLKKSAKEQDVTLGYSYHTKSSYVMTSAISNACALPKPELLLDPTLIKALDTAIDSTPALAEFMRNSNLSVVDKINCLAKYCSSFPKEASTLPPTASSLEILIDNLTHHRGVCRHRAQSFMVLAQYLGVAAAISSNEDHAFAEFPLIENGVMELRAFNFGGAVTLDITPSDKRGANPFAPKPEAKNQAQQTMTSQSQAAVIAAFAKPARAAASTPQPANIFSQSRTFDAVQPFLSHDSPRAPLLMINRGTDPILVNQAIMHDLATSGVDVMHQHLYIHSPADFSRFMNAVQLRDGQRTIIPGPLQKLIKEGGVLVINWNTFDANQMASFKSILEKKGTLMGESVSKKLRIISLATRDSQEACEAFLSRTSPHRLHPDYLKQHLKNTEVANVSHATNIPEVDLFELPNWRERLFGTVTYDGNAIKLYDNGDLIQAIRSGSTLRIVNAPDDIELTALLNRIKSERKIFFNGEMISVPEQFNFVMEKRDNPLTSNNVVVTTQAVTADQAAIMLNANNLHECITRQVIDNKTNTISQHLGWFTERNHFIISDYISKSEWQELISKASQYHDKTFTFTLMPGAEIEGVAKAEHNLQQQENSRLIFSNDCDYHVSQLMEQDNNHDALVIDLTPATTYQDLIATLIDKRKNDGTMSFTYERKEMLKSLVAGRSVILNGEINQVLYQQLLPLLYPGQSQLFYNGEPVTIEGSLHLVMPHQAKELLAPGEYAAKDYSCEDYRRAFPAEQQELISKIETFYHHARQLQHTGLGQPEPPVLNYQALNRLVRALTTASSRHLHQSNPVKGLLHYDYPKKSRNYAYLNVMAKSLFAPEHLKEQDRSRKLARFVHKHKIKTREDVIRYSWELANCCDLQTARSLFFSTKDQVISTAGIDQLCTIIKPFQQSVTEPSPKKSAGHKAAAQLRELLHDEYTHAIFLKGEPGSGKTHNIRSLKKELPKGHYHKGTDQITAWLEAIPQGKDPIILHLDEANMELPGSWDLFKGLFRKDASIYYQGKSYPLKPQHKVIFTGNSESLPGRYFHDFFRQYAETLHFAMPLESWIKENFILKELRDLKIHPDKHDIVSSQLLWAFYHINDYNPHLEISLRDINSLLRRFALLTLSINQPEEAARQTCLSEFAAAIPNIAKRRQFIDAVNEMAMTTQPVTASEKPVRVIQDLVIPATKQYIVDAIEQDLLISKHAGKDTAYRRGILLEGGSGVGKSSLYKAVLDSQDPKIKYYELSVDNTDNVAKTLIKAYLEGSKVILDELNLNERIEGLLNDLLDGVLPTDTEYRKMITAIAQTDNPEPQSGFQLFASQNSGTMAGRKALSPALRNRFHMIYVDDYSKSELVSILEHNRIPDAEKMVDQFFRERTQHPQRVNTRTLFEWMKQQMTQQGTIVFKQ